jgi:hypothetical protein
MPTVIERLRKRRFYPFQIGDETQLVRALTFKEIDAAESIGNERASQGYVIGKATGNADGSPAFTQGEDEDAKVFGQRVLDELDLPTDTSAQIMAIVTKLTKGPPLEDAIKN